MPAFSNSTNPYPYNETIPIPITEITQQYYSYTFPSESYIIILVGIILPFIATLSNIGIILYPHFGSKLYSYPETSTSPSSNNNNNNNTPITVVRKKISTQVLLFLEKSTCDTIISIFTLTINIINVSQGGWSVGRLGCLAHGFVFIYTSCVGYIITFLLLYTSYKCILRKQALGRGKLLIMIWSSVGIGIFLSILMLCYIQEYQVFCVSSVKYICWMNFDLVVLVGNNNTTTTSTSNGFVLFWRCLFYGVLFCSCIGLVLFWVQSKKELGEARILNHLFSESRYLGNNGSMFSSNAQSGAVSSVASQVGQVGIQVEVQEQSLILNLWIAFSWVSGWIVYVVVLLISELSGQRYIEGLAMSGLFLSMAINPFIATKYSGEMRKKSTVAERIYGEMTETTPQQAEREAARRMSRSSIPFESVDEPSGGGGDISSNR